jgi:hypothetical protein
MKIQAMASGLVPLSSVIVFYGREWEDCEGTAGLTCEECQELMASWERDDRRAAREMGRPSYMVPHRYRMVSE